MFDNAEIEEWEIVLEKGGPGSGEQAGHPFRGNGHTGAVFAAGAHNSRGDESMSSGQHMDASNAHAQMGIQALHAGQYGLAAKHFDESARHGAFAAKILNQSGAAKDLHQATKMSYANAHHAGDMARLANKSVRSYARSVNHGADAHTADLAAMDAQKAVAQAHAAAAAVSAIHSEISAARMGNAIANNAHLRNAG